MPHIPEAELHAYLDQALGRLRCVEIESHLADCTPCRTARDEIAALRDRTTAMLARLAPRGTTTPPVSEIRRRAAARVFQRQRVRQRAAWAASLFVALGLGWGASYLVPPPAASRSAAINAAPAASPAPAPVVQQPAGPAPTMATASPPTPVEPATEDRPDRSVHRPVRRRPAPAPARSKPQTSEPSEFASVGPIQKDGQLEWGGMWRTLSWDRAKEQVGATPARIDGLPVTEVQVQTGDSGHKPLMVVAQQLASGEVIRTIEGPISDVSALLDNHPLQPSESSGNASASRAPAGGSPVGSALTFRHGDRMFAVTGSLPSDSLRAMMRRLNLMSRVR
jgi:putative zinc finger protein